MDSEAQIGYGGTVKVTPGGSLKWYHAPRTMGSGDRKSDSSFEKQLVERLTDRKNIMHSHEVFKV